MPVVVEIGMRASALIILDHVSERIYKCIKKLLVFINSRHPLSPTMPPFRANLYTTFALTTLLIRLLGTLIYYLPRFTRPHEAWTYRQVIGVRLYSLGLNYLTAVEYRAPKTLTPGREGDRFIVISPLDTAMSNQLALHYSRSSILTSVPFIRPVPIGAVWHPALPSSKPARVILHFHGGAYVVGGVRLNINSWSPSILSEVMKSHDILPQYRLAMEETASFPAALQDGITAYVYLLEKLGLEPQNITLSGDSAVGNLVLSMIRYLAEEKEKGTGVLPLPAAALLWSPWLDLTENGARKVDRHPRRWVDYLSGTLLDWGIRRVTPEGWKRGHRFLSPLGNGFRTLGMPIFLQAGTEEVFFEDQVAFVEEMRALGNDIEICEVKDAPHDIFGAGNVLGFEKEAEEAMERARTYVNKRVGWFG
ncbi:alpha/beta-hydrolase [Aspergillus vadensis CBS 113365]|uniref:Alpha/beta-hydrolase n=1 Tax=Aspergillus vadensis (strain CBS 113365 / IMI 142717 / IBT 24658) TaxID=1448311 RepID=A0A319BMA8_ASPVC|nr:alpha/beta-hydrolase [Aspergillus vadensis CBS 113365]PYH73805.1 alpha/beta-hydrolase [Aspergillus vadensis CBS 113365]